MSNAEGTTDTPLSDLIAAHRSSPSETNWARFLDAFRTSTLGVIANGMPGDATGDVVSTAEHPLTLASTRHASGRAMILAFADPVAFVERFGFQFNAEIAGEAVLTVALFNRECQGVLVNSALAKVSIVIDRAAMESLVRPASERSRLKPWWRFWS